MSPGQTGSQKHEYSSERYPERKSFYIVKFLTAWYDSGANKKYGANATEFVTYLVWQEDKNHYRSSIPTIDVVLMERLNIKSPTTLKRIRSSLAKDGWIHYQRGFKGGYSIYWTKIPALALGPATGTNPSNQLGSKIDPIGVSITGSIVADLYTPSPTPPPHDGEAFREVGAKTRPRRKAADSLLSQKAPPASVTEGLAYTTDVIALAWEVARLFNGKSPNASRAVETVQKIVRQFAESIARDKTAAVRLKDYYSLHDVEKWQREVETGTRLPPDAAPLTVCGYLFPRTNGGRQTRPEPLLPDGVEYHAAKQAEYEALLEKEQQKESPNVSTAA